jgi:molybdopterin converting factor small subunit
LKEYAHREKAEVALPDASTVGDLLEQLGGQAIPLWNSLAVAVNRSYAMRTTLLQDGDEVALLPPVSGGSR